MSTTNRVAPAGLTREAPIGQVPLDILPLILPSRYVSSDRLAAFTDRESGRMPKGPQRVTAICNWLYENLAYERGSTDETTTADEVLLQRTGVCRDFAHLGIAFCRALSIVGPFRELLRLRAGAS